MVLHFQCEVCTYVGHNGTWKDKELKMLVDIMRRMKGDLAVAPPRHSSERWLYVTVIFTLVRRHLSFF